MTRNAQPRSWSSSERDAIRDPRLLIQSLSVLALVVAGFVLHPVLHYAPSVVALLGAGLLIAVSTVETNEVLKEVEWPTLAFFAGLFVMVGSLIETGVIGKLSDALASAPGGSELGATMRLLFGSAVLSGDRRQHPLRRHHGPHHRRPRPRHGRPADGHHVLWWALALGADLGGNATAIGASANVVVLGIAERNRQPHLLLAVHQVRPRRHRRPPSPSARPTCGCATSPSPPDLANSMINRT